MKYVKYELNVSNPFTSSGKAKPYKLYAYGFKPHALSCILYTCIIQVILFQKNAMGKLGNHDL